MSPLRLHVVIASTRPGRIGPIIAEWFAAAARSHGRFDVEVVDLADCELPLLDEIGHPRLGQYGNEHTVRWSETVARGDAFVFVTPEYNHIMPPPLANAINYLSREWAYKPAGFVSYGGVSAGTRGVQSAKLLVAALRMMPIPDTVAIPFVTRAVDPEAGTFTADERVVAAAAAMLTELGRWAEALAPLRQTGA